MEHTKEFYEKKLEVINHIISDLQMKSDEIHSYIKTHGLRPEKIDAETMRQLCNDLNNAKQKKELYQEFIRILGEHG